MDKLDTAIPSLVAPKDVQRYLPLNFQQVHYLIKKGRLPFVRLGEKKIYLTKATIETIQKEGTDAFRPIPKQQPVFLYSQGGK